VAELDVLAALAEVAEREGYVRPDVTDGYDLDVEGGRHPVVERMMARERFIPNDLRLTEDARVVILTGPNMAGKSTVLRQAGLIVLMAQVGSFVPARGPRWASSTGCSRASGASDNLVRGQSTFMVEMTETSAILAAGHAPLARAARRGGARHEHVRRRVDRVERERAPARRGGVQDGVRHALPRAGRARDELPAVRNMTVEVREAGGRVLFLHRLVEGGASRSYGIEVGAAGGAPRAGAGAAREVLAVLEGEGAAIAVARGAKQAPLGRKSRRGADGRPADAGQLALFAAAPAAPPPPHPVVEELEGVDADHLTPMQALALVARLSAEARRGRADA
jgi:DNA mismatch repair protein MutS